MNAPNPLVRTGEETAATEGAGLFHDATEAVTKIQDGKLVEGFANAAGAAAGVAQFLMDPIAGLLSAGFGWLIEHVDFLREPLDWLVGDQQTLDGMAKTWASVSSYLTDTATDLGNAVKNDTGRGRAATRTPTARSGRIGRPPTRRSPNRPEGCRCWSRPARPSSRSFATSCGT
jgi:hypothetical protein